MDADFWSERWELNQIGFHQNNVHRHLIEFGPAWLGEGEATVLVPLCGKSLDLAHLCGLGHRVIGVELVASAVEQLMASFGPGATAEPLGAHTRWRHPAQPRLTVIQGDVLRLGELGGGLPHITHVWDRAALVALDAPRRAAYAATLRAVAPGASVLLNILDYGPDLDNGPPHSVQVQELDLLYTNCVRTLLRSEPESLSPSMISRGIQALTSQTWRFSLPHDPN